VKLLEKLRAFRLPEIKPRPDRSAAIGEQETAPAPAGALLPPVPGTPRPTSPDEEERADARAASAAPIHAEAIVPPPPWWGSALVFLLSGFFAVLFVKMVWPGIFGLPMTPEAAAQNGFVRGVNAISLLAIPFLLSFFPLYAAVRGVKVYEEFVEGAKEGFGVVLKIIPFLVTMLVAINMFKGAGGIDLLTRALAPVLTPLQFPPDLLPLSLMRPLSGGASLAIFTEMVQRLGPDNIVTLMAATIFGSTETTFYVVAVYFGAVGVKQTRHAIPAGLLADLAGIIAAVIICRAVLG
jgi:spore maturation protein B